jgi:hypothetical protein
MSLPSFFTDGRYERLVAVVAENRAAGPSGGLIDAALIVDALNALRALADRIAALEGTDAGFRLDAIEKRLDEVEARVAALEKAAPTPQ